MTFERAHAGPVVDRSRDEPFFTASPFVLREPARLAHVVRVGTGWLVVDGRPEPLYVIKYAESSDGIEWRRENRTCIEPQQPEEANARPWVVRGAGRLPHVVLLPRQPRLPARPPHELPDRLRRVRATASAGTAWTRRPGSTSPARAGTP